ncbi:hypothetical protein Ae201684P_019659 [Aphanomyces euteiches]|nr:hypothetical protein Ae201684P_019659 [Aphanomyces euteiches]
MIQCSLQDTIPRHSTILIEPIASSPVQVARSLNQPQDAVTWVQIRNAGDSPLICSPGEPIGTFTILPPDFEELGHPDENHATDTDTHATPASEELPPDDPLSPSLSQHVYPNYIAAVLSTPVLNELPINWEGSTLNPTQREMLRKILLQHDIFVTTSKAPGRTDLVKCYINTGSAHPIKQAPYRVSQREGEIMEAEIQQYLELGLIRPSTSPWASPVLMIRKPDGSIRFCIDYRRLNEVTIKDSYPLPRIEDLLDVLGKAKYFSTMDVESGYWNVRMEEDSIPKTAFTCKFGLYEWLVMPFGLCNAVPQFERLMEHVLRDQIWRSCLVYLDDVIVYSDNFTSHLARVNDVLCCFARAGFKLKMSKCHWGKSSVAFLGHIVTPAGILPNPEKVKSVLKIRELRNVAEVRAFLGLAGYFRRFIKGFAAIANPLEQLKTNWLAPRSWRIPISNNPSSSTWTLARSRQVLDATQRRWINKKDGTSEIECFGLVWATTKFRPYIDKRHFTIYTDHAALVWLFKVGSKSGNSKLARWIIQLQALDFTVIHRPGTAMGCADGLSRLPISAITRSVAARQQTVIPDLAEATPDPELPPYNDDSYELPTSPLASAQGDDPFIIAMNAYIQDSALPADPSLLTLVTRTHDQYALQGTLLCRRVILKTPIRNPELHLVPVIPLGWTRRVLQLCHDSPLAGHFGVARTLDRVRRVAYWHGWRSDVHEYCRVCVRCGAAKGSRPWRQGRLQRMPIYLLRGPFNFLVVDALGPFPITPRENRYVLIFIDYFTRWPEAFAVPDLKTSTFTRVLIDEVLCRYGVPERLLSDRGTNFVSELAHSMYKVLGIDKLSSAAGHPQSQGLVERFNSTLATMLKMYVNSVQTDWDLYLPRLLWAYRTAYHETLGDTPYFCLFGRDPISLLHLTFLNQDPPWRSNDLPQWRRQQSSWFLATRRLVESQLIKGQNRDQRTSRQRPIEFQPANSV